MSQNNYKKIQNTKATTTSPIFENKTLDLARFFAYLNLGISSVATTYKAYNNNDTQMIAFVVFVVTSYMVLEASLRAIDRLPRSEETERLALKVVVWLVSSALLFGFVYQLGTAFGTCLPLTMLMLCVVTSTSVCMFYFYIIIDDRTDDDRKNGRCCCTFSNSPRLCCNSNVNVVNEDYSNKHVDAILEKV